MRLAILALLVLTACDGRPCLKSHNELILIPTQIGSVMVLQQFWVPVCDQYAAGDQ